METSLLLFFFEKARTDRVIVSSYLCVTDKTKTVTTLPNKKTDLTSYIYLHGINLKGCFRRVKPFKKNCMLDWFL